MKPRSVLDCVHGFFVCTIGRHLLGIFLRITICQDPLIFCIYLEEAFGKCITRSNTPAIWDRYETSGLVYLSLQGT